MGKRASISLTEPNEQWVQSQIDSREYSSRSEVLNDLIRKRREIETIRAVLLEAESSVSQNGWSQFDRNSLLADIKAKFQS